MNKLVIGLTLIISACQSPPVDSRTITDMKFKGPSALCTDIETILSNPPPDITERQKLEAQLSRDACRLPSEDISAEIVETALNGEMIAYEIDGNVLTVYAKAQHNEAKLCCSLQPNLLPIAKVQDGYLFAGRYKLKDLNKARLQFIRPDFSGKPIAYKGPLAPDDIPLNEEELQGTLTEGVIMSEALDEKRSYQLYTPPGFKPGDNVSVIMLGDGSSLGFYIRQWESLITAGIVAPFVAIGVKSGERAIVDPAKKYDFDVRNADYIHEIKHGPQRFDKHLTFVTDELLQQIITNLNIEPSPEKTVLMGGSSAGSFALWGVMERPDIFGHSVGTSPSGPIPSDISKAAAQRNYYVSAGLYEPGFLANALLYKEALEKAGASVDMKSYPDGHSSDHRAMRMFEVLPNILPPN